jgi:hypothetical protein
MVFNNFVFGEKDFIKLLESLRMDTDYNLFNKDVEEFLVDFYSYIETENLKEDPNYVFEDEYYLDHNYMWVNDFNKNNLGSYDISKIIDDLQIHIESELIEGYFQTILIQLIKKIENYIKFVAPTI